jgi:hypothetical protein
MDMDTQEHSATIKTIAVGIKPDAIEKHAKVPPDRAIEELIWNAIDAEATYIEVTFYENPMLGIERIVVSDNGHGIAVSEAETAFENIGGSAKRLRRRSPNLERPYHGKDGEGRYKALNIGRHVEWHSRTLTNGSVVTFSVCIDGSQMSSADITVPVSCDGTPGCDVVLTHLRDGVSGLRSPNRLEALTYRLAPYLMANPGIRIRYDGEMLDLSKALVQERTLDVAEAESDKHPALTFQLRVLEWSKKRNPSLFLCDQHGVALDEIPLDPKGVRYPFTAYVLSERMRELHDSDRLAAGDLDPEVHRFKEVAKHTLRDYFRQRRAEEARFIADKMRREGVYPYSHQPATPVEKADQQVFDICAATLHEFLPGFDTGEKSSRRLAYHLLREALQSNPTNVGRIFKEVLNLTEEQQADLVALLARTSLGAIIHTAKTVSDRLCFLNGLEQIVHDKTIRKHLKERKQLHRILVEELWIFGDEYTLGSDDVSLRSVLAEHRKIIGIDNLDEQVPKEDVTDLADIPDLLLWHQFLRGSGDRYEHLVIELKRPSVNISFEEVEQVRRYAAKVLGNRHFDKERTHWTFVALSDGISRDQESEMLQKDRQRGHLVNGPHHDVWIRTWGEVIQDAKIRLTWVQDRLQFAVSDNSEGMQYLRRKFSHLLPEVAKEEGKLGESSGNDEQ